MNRIINFYGHTALVGATIGAFCGYNKPRKPYSQFNNVINGAMFGYLYPVTLLLLYKKRIMF